MKSLCILAIGVISVSAWAADIGVVEEIIAKVNGDIVTSTDVDRARKILMAELQERGGLKGPELQKEYAEREKAVLSDRIDQLLLVQKGKELSINVDSEVSKQMAEIQRKSGIVDPEKFQTWVREQSGQSYEDFKQEMKNSFLTRRVIYQEVGGKINVPKAELHKYYDEHKAEFMRKDVVFLRELLVSTEGKDAKGIAAAQKKALELTTRARKGEKFTDLVRDNSEAATKESMGELPPFEPGQLSKPIEDVVFKQERGFVTDPFRIDKGFLILKVEERHKAGQASYEEVEQEIMERLSNSRMQPAVRTFLTKLRQDAFLEIKPGYVDAYAAPGKNTAWSDPAQLKPETVTKEEVASKKRKKKVFGMVPIPGTSQANTGGTSKTK
jgi:parvulin-like peptidyl-prolyl isomerase